VIVANSVSSVARTYGRGKLLSILEKELILAKIIVINNNRFVPIVIDWNSYWQPLHQLGLFEIEGKLNKLYCAWKSYIQSHFNASSQRDYCYCYFDLLNNLISNFRKTDHRWAISLRTTLGFECFGISDSLNEDLIGAATCTLRNPCYLLAKLKMPTVLDDAQYLPIITVSDTAKPELFTHYRQYTLSRDSKLSILLYPIVNEVKLSASFKLLNTFSGLIRYVADPWTDERAELIYERVLKNIIQTTFFDFNGISSLEFVDVGAGSGSLVSKFCQQIQKENIVKDSYPQFRVWSIDLEPTDPSSFFKTSFLRKSVDTLTYIGDDYRSWLGQNQPLPKPNGIRIAIISKLLDVFSNYSFLQTSPEKLLKYWPKLLSSTDLNESMPKYCLAVNGKGPQALMISNSRLVTEKGKIYPLLSLSDYFRSIAILSDCENSTLPDTGKYYLPLRSFNSQCLVTFDGNSIISSLSNNCNYLIIEDADLTQRGLFNHCKQYSLDFLTVRDMTKALKLKGNYLYVIWAKNNFVPIIEGETIW
jgi:hypothetical protein